MILPRLIRYRDAPFYCGMDKSLFDKNIRPLVDIEIHDGPKYVAFDRVDLDAAIDVFILSHGKSRSTNKEIPKCQKEYQDYNMIKSRRSGASTKESKVTEDSENVYEQALKRKQK